ncbi:hypothetical protein [Tahibacter aquaticus]|uniref:hypothetical protein n=1 Tax=Tahibacter aquaticus TaxID=520092 RepID=UPI00141519D5|nr:hypothetical protein [Tahibacter aquaticus]
MESAAAGGDKLPISSNDTTRQAIRKGWYMARSAAKVRSSGMYAVLETPARIAMQPMQGWPNTAVALTDSIAPAQLRTLRSFYKLRKP